MVKRLTLRKCRDGSAAARSLVGTRRGYNGQRSGRYQRQKHQLRLGENGSWVFYYSNGDASRLKLMANRDLGAAMLKLLLEVRVFDVAEALEKILHAGW